MNRRSFIARVKRTLLAVVVLIFAACTSSKAPTTVTFTSPLPDAAIVAGSDVPIQAQVTGEGISRVEVILDGQAYAILTTGEKSQGMPNFPVQVHWIAGGEGLHVVQLSVYGADGQLLTKSDVLIFRVEAAVEIATATSVPAATATSAPTSTPLGSPVSITGTPSAQSVITASASITNTDIPSLTIVSERVNVRDGPGTEYPIIGQLQKGDVAEVRGRNADSTWWKINYAKAASGTGWVRGDLVEVNSAAGQVASVAIPPTPTPGLIPVTTTPPAATATPSEPECNASSPTWKGGDPRYPFCAAKVLTWYDNQDGAHRYENGRDVSLSLSWDLSGIDDLWIVFEQDNSGYCDYTKPSAKSINERIPHAGAFLFNVKDFPGGATLRIFLRVKRTDGQVVEYGDKRLCIY